MKVLYFVLLALALPTLAMAQGSAGQALGAWTSDQDKIDFWAKSGWTFSEASKEGQTAINWESIAPLNASAAVSAADFNLASFNPRNYDIPLKSNESVLIQVGEKGTILFLSTDRVDVLYQRELLNRAAASKQ